MKFIDEKGRLLGIINLFDLFCILFLLSLIPMFYFGARIFSQEESGKRIIKQVNSQINEKYNQLQSLEGKLAILNSEINNNTVVKNSKYLKYYIRGFEDGYAERKSNSKN